MGKTSLINIIDNFGETETDLGFFLFSQNPKCGNLCVPLVVIILVLSIEFEVDVNTRQIPSKNFLDQVLHIFFKIIADQALNGP